MDGLVIVRMGCAENADLGLAGRVVAEASEGGGPQRSAGHGAERAGAQSQ